MDADQSGLVHIDEICMVHDTDKEAMLGILDTNGDGEVSPTEWLNYLMVRQPLAIAPPSSRAPDLASPTQAKKEAKGKKKFGYFLNFLEQARRIP